MAKRFKINSSSSSSSSSSPSSSILEFPAKPHHLFVVFMGFLFILAALLSSSAAADPSKPSSPSSYNMASTTTLPSHTTSFASAAKTNDFRPRKRERGENRKSTSREFEAGDHEVPSGPNPISNR